MKKTEELRLGNYVNLSDGSVDDDMRKVVGIQQNGINVLIKGCEHVVAYRPTKYIYSIPLTEEILLKCGFDKVREYFTIDNEFDIFKDKKGYYTHINCGNIYLNSLHQLQNLYYALTQEELEIKL